MRQHFSTTLVVPLYTKIGMIILEQNAIEESLECIFRSVMPSYITALPSLIFANMGFDEKLNFTTSILSSHQLISEGLFDEFIQLRNQMKILHQEQIKFAKARIKFGANSQISDNSNAGEVEFYLLSGENEVDCSLASLDELIDSYHRVREMLIEFESSLLDEQGFD